MKGSKNLIGDRLRAARISEKPKATQGDISARLETLGITLSENSVGKIEMGLRAVTDVQLVAFAAALKVNVLWLLGQSEQR